ASVISSITDLISNDLFTSEFFFSSRRRHTRSKRDWSSDVCSSDLTSRSSLWAVELRCEKSRGRLQNRVRPAQLAHFFLQLSEPLGVAGRGPGSVALVDLGLHDPVPQSLGIDPELLAHTAERSRPRRWIPSRFHGHPRGPLPTFIGVLPRCCHTPHPPVGSEPPPDPGRFSLRPGPQVGPRGSTGRTSRQPARSCLLRGTR